MERRDFLVAAGLAGIGASGAVAATPDAPRPSGGRKPLLMKLGCQSGPSTEEHFAFLARYGVTNLSASAPATSIAVPSPPRENTAS